MSKQPRSGTQAPAFSAQAIGGAYYGRTYMGTERTTVIIGPEGKIKAILPKVKPDEHLSQVMEVI